MRICCEKGIAMLVAVMAVLLLSALGAALVLITSSETMVASSFRDGVEGVYAADAVLERTLDELAAIDDWNTVLDGSTQSSFLDGPIGERLLVDGTSVDVAVVLNLANCGKAPGCTDADMDRSTAGRPWGANNPRWRVYASGNVSDLLPEGLESSFYVIVMAADDAAENDGKPLEDGAAPCHGALPAGSPPSCNPGSGILAMRAEAFGPRGTHKAVEITLAREAAPAHDEDARAPAVRVLSWRQMR